MYEEFDKLDDYHTVHKWLLIDMRPFKHTILNQCSKWVNLYKDHLLNYVLSRLNVGTMDWRRSSKHFHTNWLYFRNLKHS